MGYGDARLTAYAELCLAATLWVWLWVPCKAAAAAVIGRHARRSVAGAASTFDGARETLLVGAARATSTAVGYAGTLASAVVGRLGLVTVLALCLVAGAVVTEVHPEMIVGIDAAYNALYLPVVAPLRLVLNVVRLLGDSVLPLWNAVSETVAVPAVTVLRVASQCNTGGDVLTSWITNSAGFIKNVAAAFTRWALVDRFANPLGLEPAVANARAMGQGAITLAECACEAAGPLARAVLAFLYTNRTDVAVSSTINAGLSFVQVPLNASLAAFRDEPDLIVDFEYIIDTFKTAAFSWTDVANDWLTRVAHVVDPDAKVVQLFSVTGHGAAVVLEGIRVPARALQNTKHIFSSEGPHICRDIFMASYFWEELDTFFTVIFDDVLKSVSTTVAMYANAQKYFLKTVAGCARLVCEYLVGVAVNAAGAFVGVPNLPFRDYQTCYVDTTGRWANGMNQSWVPPKSSLRFTIAMVGRLDALVVQNIRMFGFWFARTVSISSAQSTEFMIKSTAELVYMVAAKGAYMATSTSSVGNAQAACMSAISSQWRAETYNLIETIPEDTLRTAYVDILEAKGTLNPHLPCDAYTVPNYALMGGLTAYYVAGGLCNVKYVDGTPVKCDMRDRNSCPGMNLPFGDLVVNPVCALADAASSTLRTVAETGTLLTDVADVAVITAVNCLTSAFDSRSTCELAANVSSAAFAYTSLCDLEENIVKLSNLQVSLLHLLFMPIYNNRGMDPTISWRGSAAVRGFNQTRMEYVRQSQSRCHFQADAQRCAEHSSACTWSAVVGGCVPRCSTASTRAACDVRPLCAWHDKSDGTGLCAPPHYMPYQPYPLEAGLSTLLVATVNLIGFWTPYKEVTQLIARSRARKAAFAGSQAALEASGQEYVEETLRTFVISIRDVVVGAVEFVRAVVYVVTYPTTKGDPAATFSQDVYIRFERLVFTILNTLETFVELINNSLLPVISKMLTLFVDFIGMITDPASEKYKDVAADLQTLLKSSATAMKTILLNAPGVEKLCRSIAPAANDMTQAVCKAFTAKIIPMGLQFVNGKGGATSLSYAASNPSATFVPSASYAPPWSASPPPSAPAPVWVTPSIPNNLTFVARRSLSAYNPIIFNLESSPYVKTALERAKNTSYHLGDDVPNIVLRTSLLDDLQCAAKPCECAGNKITDMKTMLNNINPFTEIYSLINSIPEFTDVDCCIGCWPPCTTTEMSIWDDVIPQRFKTLLNTMETKWTSIVSSNLGDVNTLLDCVAGMATNCYALPSCAGPIPDLWCSEKTKFDENSLCAMNALDTISNKIIDAVQKALLDQVNSLPIVQDMNTQIDTMVEFFEDKYDEAREFVSPLAGGVYTLTGDIRSIVYRDLPRSVSMRMGSLLELNGVSSFSCDNLELDCEAEDTSTVSPVSRCRWDEDCVGKACTSPSALLYPNCAAQADANNTMDYRCPCASEPTAGSHCNVASGLCTIGPSPFAAPPLSTCPPNGKLSLVDSSSYFNALCYVTPIWKYAYAEKTRHPSIDAYRYLLTTEAKVPELCRSYCQPSAFNDDNQLSQVSDGSACVCEVGVSMAYGAVGRGVTALLGSSSSIPVPSKRRSLLGAPPSNITVMEALDYKKGHECTLDEDCGFSPLNGMAPVCESAWGAALPCVSCPDRSPETGAVYVCASRRCACAAASRAAHDLRPAKPSSLVIPEVRARTWTGNSWCDRMVSDYASRAQHTELELLHVERCTRLRQAGHEAAAATGLATLPPDIFYNPTRMSTVLKALIAGLAELTALAEDATDVETFTRIVKAGADPLIVIPVSKALRDSGAGDIVERIASAIVTVNRHLTSGHMPTMGAVREFATSEEARAIAAPFIAHVSETAQAALRAPLDHAVAARKLLAEAMRCGVLGEFVDQMTRVGENLDWAYSKYYRWALCRFKNEYGTYEDCGAIPARPHVEVAPSKLRPAATRTASLPTFEWNVKYALDVVTHYAKKAVNAALDGLQQLLSCDYDGSVQCQRRGDWKLADVCAWGFVTAVVAGALGSSMFGMPAPGPVMLVAAVAVGGAVLAYGMPIGCLVRAPPAIPVCVWDDAFDAVDTWILPRTIRWPTALVPNTTRTTGRLAAAPTDCGEDPIGLHDGLRWLQWMGTATGVWKADYYDDKPVRSEKFVACAAVTALNSVPAAVGGVCIAIVVFAAAHVALMGIYCVATACGGATTSLKWRVAELFAEET